jgi:hypothetical protein
MSPRNAWKSYPAACEQRSGIITKGRLYSYSERLWRSWRDSTDLVNLFSAVVHRRDCHLSGFRIGSTALRRHGVAMPF